MCVHQTPKGQRSKNKYYPRMKKIVLLFAVLASLNITAQKQQRPITLAYCLDGTSLVLNTGEKRKSADPQIGYVTFYEDKVVFDNDPTATYIFAHKIEHVSFFQGETKILRNEEDNDIVYITPLVMADNKLDEVCLCISFKYPKHPKDDIRISSDIYLMDIPSFQSLCNHYNGISNSLFINNSYNYVEETVYKDTNSGTKTYYSKRYEHKDCNICRGSGICQTCNGNGIHSAYRVKSECPNCFIKNGHRTGKCTWCGGTGKVFGLK